MYKIRKSIGSLKLKDKFSTALIFAKRDIKTRYAGSFLGTAWIVLYPMAMATITSLVFSIAFQKTIQEIPFFIYTLAGFACWIFFTQSISSSARSLVQNREIIINNKIDTELIIIGVLISRSLDLLVTTLFVVIASLTLHVFIFSLPTFILSILALILIVLILSLLVAAGNAYFRDVQALTDIFLNIVFYATPIVYPLVAIPEKYRGLLTLNPLTSIISGFRSALLPLPTNVNYLMIAVIVEILLLVFVYRLYKKLERKFAELL